MKIDLVGKKIEKLTVVSIGGTTSRGIRLWNCLCECGNTVQITTGNLTSCRPTKSCGCALKYRKQNLRLWANPDSLVRQLMGHYQQGAKRRKLEFALDIEIFRTLIFQDCFYCGAKPNQVYRPTRYKSALRYNGIDRKENEKGYIPENCVPCCKICNQAKSTLSQKEFFDWIWKINIKHCFNPLRSVA